MVLVITNLAELVALAPVVSLVQVRMVQAPVEMAAAVVPVPMVVVQLPAIPVLVLRPGMEVMVPTAQVVVSMDHRAATQLPVKVPEAVVLTLEEVVITAALVQLTYLSTLLMAPVAVAVAPAVSR